MTADLREHLQLALGDSYTIERELGGGGMSRVFLAEEMALRRRVVLKVLPPELAANVNVDRFRREIQMAARLQHPHLIPVLAAGAAGELLYYTMPFIEGDSLRARLVHDGKPALGDALRILRDVADALAYAHRQGLVHRDIKPENILFSERHALVTDFGVAKALSQTVGDAALTNVGVALGTPAYMAPEQAAADPDTDHRADIYAFGILAYELLSGATPFGNRSPSKMLAAHLVEPPEPLTKRCADVPPAVAGLVMQCLAKQPADRPQTAGEIVQRLDAGASGELVPTRRPGTRSLALVGVAALVLVAGTIGVLGPWRTSDAASLETERVAVAVFDNETGDPSLDPVGRMTADWLTQGLAQTGLVKVVDSKSALAAATDAGAMGAVQALASETGATTVVSGTYYKFGDTLQFQAQVVDAQTGDIIFALDPVRAAAADPTAGIERLRQRLLGGLATHYNPQLLTFAANSSSPPTYEAYQAFMQGVETLTQRSQPLQALPHFQRAAELDPSFAAAKLWILESLSSLGRLAETDSVARSLIGARDRLTPIERTMLDMVLANMQGDRQAVLTLARHGADIAPGSEWSMILARQLHANGRPLEALGVLMQVPPDRGLLKGSPIHLIVQKDIYEALGEHQLQLAAMEELARQFPDQHYFKAMQIAPLAELGRTGDAREMSEQIASLIPSPRFSPRNSLRQVGAELRAYGHSDLATETLARALADYDRVPADSLRLRPYQLGMAVTLVLLERWDEAHTILERLTVGDTSLTAPGYLGIVAARRGDTAQVREVSARLAAHTGRYSLGQHTFWRARIAAALGDNSQAVALLREAERQGAPVRIIWRTVPEFEALADYPPYQELVRPRG